MKSLPQPNIVFILFDDLGWADLPCYGNAHHHAPNLDRLASEGMRFTSAYAHPTCSPARAALLTGKSPGRLHITDFISGVGATVANPKGLGYPYPEHSRLIQADTPNPGLRRDAFTLGKAFRKGGYRTAFIGKWHLGAHSAPEDHGFDWVRHVTENGSCRTFENGRFVEDVKIDAALDFIDAPQGAPFLLYLSLNAVHPSYVGSYTVKHGADPRRLARFADAPDPRLAAMIEHVDEAIGRLLDRLDASGLSENTVVICASDNGGTHVRNHPLRACKGYVYEGGVRVPLIVKAPRRVSSGSTCDAMLIAEDFFPTLLALAELPLEPCCHVDGSSFLPVLSEPERSTRDVLFWHFPHWFRPHLGDAASKPCGAIREGPWKLFDFFEDGSLELYHVGGGDIGESKNVASEHPERCRHMLERLRKWRADSGVLMPTLK